MGRDKPAYKESHTQEVSRTGDRKTGTAMGMDERRRRLERAGQVTAKKGTVPGDDERKPLRSGKLAQYADIKSTAGIVIPEVKRVVLDRKKKGSGSHRTNIIYPSEMARSDWCPRATYYRMSGLPEPSSSTSFTLENVFAEGNSIHSKWQRWLSDTGKLWGDWRCTRCSEYVKNSLKPGPVEHGSCVGTNFAQLNPLGENADVTDFSHAWLYKEVTLQSTSLPISGHADGGLVKHNALIEIKSVGLGTLRFDAPKLFAQNTYSVAGRKIVDIEGMWKNLHTPLLPHVKQGNIYLWMAKEMGMPFDRISFLYEFKANQQAKEFIVSLSTEIMEPMLDTSADIVYALEHGTPPACPHGGCAKCRAYEKEE